MSQWTKEAALQELVTLIEETERLQVHTDSQRSTRGGLFGHASSSMKSLADAPFI